MMNQPTAKGNIMNARSLFWATLESGAGSGETIP